MSVHDMFCFCGFILFIFFGGIGIYILIKEDERNEDND